MMTGGDSTLGIKCHHVHWFDCLVISHVYCDTTHWPGDTRVTERHSS